MTKPNHNSVPEGNSSPDEAPAFSGNVDQSCFDAWLACAALCASEFDRRVLVYISRDEARLLARHWAGKFEASERWVAATSQFGSSEWRIRALANQRVEVLVAAGVLSKVDLDQIWDEPYEQNKEFWDAFKAAGCITGFQLDQYEEKYPEDPGEHTAADADLVPFADTAVQSPASPPST